ncbi:MAG TPA: phospholipid carrier-dependent glycosyltransferase [Candidatus Dormibacteraeota bacterium]
MGFVLRFYSPIMPDFFLHPFRGPLISNCVQGTPVNTEGQPGAVCGLAYPFMKGYCPTAVVSGARCQEPLSPPNGEVFDEIYFPHFAYFDLKGMEVCRPTSVECYNYFDPEPPLGKLIIGAGDWAYGWYRAHFEGAKGDYVDLGFNTFGWRIAACIFGTLCIPLMYLFARRLWPKRLFALAAATLVCFDGLFFVESRIGMIDIFPIFFILLSYFLYLVHIQSPTPRASIISLFLLGIALGLGIAAKWIVLAAYASIVFLLVVRAIRRNVDLDVGPAERPIWSWGRGSGPAIAGGTPWRQYLPLALVALLVIPVAIYLASWYPFFARGQFHTLADLITYQQAAFRYHAGLTATHPYGSPWWSWPFDARPVLYYAEYELGTDQFTGRPLFALLYNLGNPWIWWTSLPCLLALPYFAIRHRSFPAAVILIGFVTQFLPWAPIARVLFLYHMFGGLIFMILALAFVLAYVAELMPGAGRALLVGHLGIAVAFFFYFYPIWTALPLSEPAFLLESGTPPWGPKIWLIAGCNAQLPPAEPQLWCWY